MDDKEPKPISWMRTAERNGNGSYKIQEGNIPVYDSLPIGTSVLYLAGNKEFVPVNSRKDIGDFFPIPDYQEGTVCEKVEKTEINPSSVTITTKEGIRVYPLNTLIWIQP